MTFKLDLSKEGVGKGRCPRQREWEVGRRPGEKVPTVLKELHKVQCGQPALCYNSVQLRVNKTAE